MKIYIISFLMFLSLAFIGCKGHSHPQDPKMKQAFEIHEQYLEVAKKSRELLQNLPPDDSLSDMLNTQLDQWSENIIEVPGFEHEHHHDHDGHHPHHHHNDDAYSHLTPDDMLAVQQELLDSVQVIKKRIIGHIAEFN